MMKNLKRIKVVVIGASAGGVEALKSILPCFKTPSEVSVLVVLHISPTAPSLLPDLYRDQCSFGVKEAEPGEEIRAETIYFAPPDYHLSLEPNGRLSLSNEDSINFSRPAIDVLFESAALAYKDQVLGILLTGANHDGARGLKRISEMKGATIIQDPKDAEFSTMPEAALSLFNPDMVLRLKEMRKQIAKLKVKK